MAGPVAVAAADGDDGVVGVGQGGTLGEGSPDVSSRIGVDPQEQPGAARAVRDAELTAEDDRGTAVVVAEHRLPQQGKPLGLRHGRGDHGDSVLRDARVVMPVRLAGVHVEAAAEQPPVQVGAEVQVARFVARPAVPADRACRQRGLLSRRAVLAPGWCGQPVHDRMADPDRRARRDRHGQAFGQARRHVPGSGRTGQPDPGRGHVRAQFVDVHPGHSGADRAQQRAGQLIRVPGLRGLGLRGRSGRMIQEPVEPVTIESGQPDRQLATARVVGQHDDMGEGADGLRLVRRDEALDARDADGGHVRPPGRDEIGAVLGEVGAQPQPGLVQAGPGRARRLGDLAGRHVGVVVQDDRAPLPGGQVRDGRTQRVGAVEVVRRGQAVRGGRVNRLGPVGHQRDRGAALHAAAYVEDDAAQPAGEPVRIPQPVQRDEGLQERLLHDVVHVAGVEAQCAGRGRGPSAGAAPPAAGTPPGRRRGPAGPGRRRRSACCGNQAVRRGGSVRRGAGRPGPVRPG